MAQIGNVFEKIGTRETISAISSKDCDIVELVVYLRPPEVVEWRILLPTLEIEAVLDEPTI